MHHRVKKIPKRPSLRPIAKLAAADHRAGATERRGRGLSEPLADSGVFPALALELIAVGEQSGRLESMLIEVADIYDRQVEDTITRLLNLLEPALILVMGGLVGGIIISVLLAVLSLNDMVF